MVRFVFKVSENIQCVSHKVVVGDSTKALCIHVRGACSLFYTIVAVLIYKLKLFCKRSIGHGWIGHRCSQNVAVPLFFPPKKGYTCCPVYSLVRCLSGTDKQKLSISSELSLRSKISNLRKYCKVILSKVKSHLH